MNRLALCVSLFTLPGLLSAQTAPPAHEAVPAAEVASAALGPDDELTVASPEIVELDKRVLRIQADGMVNVPLVGSIRAEGLTAEQLQTKITEALKAQFRNPYISFTSIDIKSKSVSVLGAVNRPGVQQADGERTLLEMLSQAGGLRNDAGNTVRITRLASAGGGFPSGVRPILSGDSITAEISITNLFEGKNPEQNVSILPGDVISVPKAKLVYVVGNVNKAGGFVLGDSGSLTVLRALAMAEGLSSFADTAHARILRATATGQRFDQEFDLRKLQEGKAEDIRLQPDDIVFIPNSLAKRLTARAIESAISSGIGVAIWGR